MPHEVGLNILGVASTFLCALLLLSVPRRYATIPLFTLACYVTFGQMVVIAGFHFTMLRVLVLCGWIRLIMRREAGGLRFNAIDKTIIGWVLSSFTANVLLNQTSQALVNRLGFAFNMLGLYFLFRYLIRDQEDWKISIRSLAFIIIPLAAFMLIENMTRYNCFSVFGGVNPITVEREGRFRCEGPFRHPILAGTFGATLMPLFVGLWFWQKKRRTVAATAILCATIVMVTSASSGPLLAYTLGLVALPMWFLRAHMKPFRWGALFGLVSLHVFMKAPIWYLIGRISNVVGGTGWHRSELIDAAIRHFGEWWLLGSSQTAHWLGGDWLMPDDPDNIDITNQYIWEGIQGGLLAMILFIAAIGYSFRAVGIAIASTKSQPAGVSFMLWSMGASLFAHAVGFLSVMYFDQNIVFFLFLLACNAWAQDFFHGLRVTNSVPRLMPQPGDTDQGRHSKSSWRFCNARGFENHGSSSLPFGCCS